LNVAIVTAQEVETGRIVLQLLGTNNEAPCNV